MKARRPKRQRPPKSDTRKALEAAYKASYEQIPPFVLCAFCGSRKPKEELTRHHPAGRRKAAFCFTFQVCEEPCHRLIHHDPGKATLLGLLWTGRNSKELTRRDAEELIKRCPYPPTYALQLLQ